MGMVVPMYMSVHSTSTTACTVDDWNLSNPLQAVHLYVLLCIVHQKFRSILFIDGMGTSRSSNVYEQIWIGNISIDVRGQRSIAYNVIPTRITTASFWSICLKLMISMVQNYYIVSVQTFMIIYVRNGTWNNSNRIQTKKITTALYQNTIC